MFIEFQWTGNGTARLDQPQTIEKEDLEASGRRKASKAASFLRCVFVGRNGFFYSKEAVINRLRVAQRVGR
jgi:hypothetical protein